MATNTSGRPAACSRVTSERSSKPHRLVSTVTPSVIGTVKFLLVLIRYEPSFFRHTTFASQSGLGIGGFSHRVSLPVTVISQPSSVVFDEAVVPLSGGTHGTTELRSFIVGGS